MKTSQNLKVFYDGQCPLCTKEINHYKKIDKNNRVSFIDISSDSFEEKAYGLQGRDYNKIFHVQKNDSKFITGVDGFVAIWDELNCFKILSKSAKSKILRPLFDIGYVVFATVRPIFRNKDCPDEVCNR